MCYHVMLQQHTSRYTVAVWKLQIPWIKALVEQDLISIYVQEVYSYFSVYYYIY